MHLKRERKIDEKVIELKIFRRGDERGLKMEGWQVMIQ